MPVRRQSRTTSVACGHLSSCQSAVSPVPRVSPVAACRPVSRRLAVQLTSHLDGVRVAVLTEGFANCEQDVEETVRREVLRLRHIGATVDEVSVPMHPYGEYTIDS